MTPSEFFQGLNFLLIVFNFLIFFLSFFLFWLLNTDQLNVTSILFHESVRADGGELELNKVDLG